jgi:hypothetical protein
MGKQRRRCAPNNSLMLIRLAGEKAGCLACKDAREWAEVCPSRGAA